MRQLFALVVFSLIASLSQGQGSGGTYRDPNGRFTLVAPAGWKVRPLGDSVQIVHGDSYFSVMIFEHSLNARALLDDLAGHIGKKWRRFELQDRTNSSINGSAAETASYSGIKADGASSVLKIQCAVVDGVGYVLVVGYPANESAKVQETLAQIDRSFSVQKNASGPAHSSDQTTMGIEATDLTPEDAAMYHLDQPMGALVVQLDENGAAAQAGIKPHDVILSADGTAIEGAAMLEGLVRSHKPGDVTMLEICRMKTDNSTEQVSVRVTLASNRK